MKDGETEICATRVNVRDHQIALLTIIANSEF